MKYVFIDIETYSDTNITECGLDRYSRDCELLTVCYGGIRTEVRNDNLEELERLALNPGVVFVAHNASFERIVLQRAKNLPQSIRNAFEAVPINRWRCSMAKAASVGLPLSLADATGALEAPQDFGKNADGKRLIRLFCVPRKPTKKDSRTRIFPEDAPEDFERLVEYCKRDVISCRWLWNNTPHTNYPDNERELSLWMLDQKINDRGFPVDRDEVATMIETLNTRQRELADEVSRLTDGEVTKLGQRDRILQFCKKFRVRLKDLSSFTVDQALKNKAIANDKRLEKVKRVLELRQQGGRSSVTKYSKMLNAAEGRMRYSLQYCGAGRTGRWAGRGIQPQNFPRPTLKSDEVLMATEALLDGSWDLMYDRTDMMDHAANALRSMIKAPDGKLLCAADLAGIENRKLMWLADDQETLDKIRSGVDLYVELAADEIFHKPAEDITDDERFSGKTGMLACIAEDQLVLTDTGLVPIQHITTKMRVWDGESFVCHQGLVYQGMKEVLTYDGLTATEDHIVFTEQGKVTFLEAIQQRYRIVQSGSGRKTIRISRNNRASRASGGREAKSMAYHKGEARVYDLLNCGPNNRFTVSNKLVKNCGYQGYTSAVCAMAKGYGKIMEESEGARIASAWRRKFPKVVTLWKAYQNAWLEAFNDRSPVKSGKCIFQMQDRYMTITLPSGRVLFYLDPGIGADGGLRYMHYKNGSLVRESTYGGKITENICQASSRDVLAWNMPELEEAGYEIVLTVHDEVIAEIDRYESLDEEGMVSIMTKVPPWANGLPLAAEGYTAKRYKK